MPRKVYTTNWITKLPTTPEEVEQFKSECPPSECVRQQPGQIDNIIEHPVVMQLGNLGGASFVPSPIPGANNTMYKDKLTWTAIMEDGTTFGQYEVGKEHSSEEIPRDKLRKFCLLTKDDNRVVFVRELVPGWKFFYRRRTAMGQGGFIEVIHIVGWQVPVGEQFLTQMAFVYEADLSVLIGDVSLGKPQPILGKSFRWRHPVEFVAADAIVIT